MKLLALFVLRKENDTNVKILQKEFNLDSFSFYQRSKIRQFLIFSARTVVERSDFNTKQSVELKENIDAKMHVYICSDGLASIAISNNDYPQRVAHSLLAKVTEEFAKAYPSDSWKEMDEESGKMESLNGTFTKYQKPDEADPLMSLQKDLNETKEILLNTIENLLRRGETLDNLVARSADLDLQTKLFYKQAKKTNQCCYLF